MLINIGTPDSPEVADVRRYLGQFLMDPLVIDLPYPIRWSLVHGIILRSRPAASSELYRSIWTEHGSPLMKHSVDLAERVQGLLGDSWRVSVAMRYGNPSIESVVNRFRAAGVKRIFALPMYPQYSAAATLSSEREVRRVCDEREELTVLGDFHSDPGFLEAFADRIRESLVEFPADHVLFSYHGLPERQLRKSDPSGGHCLASPDCCDRRSDVNRLCYRAQSFETSRLLAAKLGWERSRWSVSFQSRLGRTRWIHPYTDEVFDELAARGVKRLAVACPAFVADCLETLEEIRIRGREQFRARGGEELHLIPSLNSSELWANAVSDLLRAELARSVA